MSEELPEFVTALNLKFEVIVAKTRKYPAEIDLQTLRITVSPTVPAPRRSELIARCVERLEAEHRGMLDDWKISDAVGERAHDAAIKAANAVVAQLPLSADEKAVAVGMAYDRFKAIAIELARGGASRDTVAAVFAAGHAYAKAYFDTK